LRSERDAYADFRGAAADRVGDAAVDADEYKTDRDPAEKNRQTGNEPFL
jgi:hypothetical protein